MESALLELRERVLEAKAKHAPLRLRGAGTKDFYGEIVSGDVLDLSGHRGIVSYEPSELVVTVRCGTPLAELETQLAERRQFLAFEPPRFGGTPTVGGVIAAGLSGPRRIQAGAARDFMLGATLLGSDGELQHFGGRVMKNVAGFDVTRLLCGSLGIFGIITDVSIKVLPQPRAEETLQLEMSERKAIEAFNRWAGLPLPISAAAWYEGHAWIRLSGADAAIRSACAVIGGEQMTADIADRWWHGLRDYTHALFSSSSVWRVSVPPTALPLESPQQPLMDWGGGVRWYCGIPEDLDIRALSGVAGGTAMRWRGEGPTTRFHPLSPAVAEIHRRLKHSFDPDGIFNRGRLIRGL